MIFLGGWGVGSYPLATHFACYYCIRAVFKWLSKVITRLRFLRLVIGLKDSRQFFNQWKAKPKPIAPCTRDISRASGELQVIARNCDWFMELFVPVVIGRSNCFGFGFSTVIWKPLYVQKCNNVVVVAKVVVVVKSHRFSHVFPPLTTFQCSTLHSKKKKKGNFYHQFREIQQIND